MQKELDEAAAQGFRIVVGSPTSGKEMALLLERTTRPEDAYTYRLLATTRTSTMQKELDEATPDGFRLLPRTMIAKERMFGGPEIVVILERPKKVEKTLQVQAPRHNSDLDVAKGSYPSQGRRLCFGWDGQPRRAHGDYGKRNPSKGVK